MWICFCCQINENLSINGFIDTSWSDLDQEGNAGDTQNLGLDEIELNFLFNVGNVSGAIHIDDYDNTGGYPNNEGIDIEQAHISYGLENGVQFTIGKYGSQLGFEREASWSLHLRSCHGSSATAGSVFNLGDVDSYVYEGVAVGYQGDAFSLNLSSNGGDSNLESDDLDMELSLATLVLKT